MNESEMESELRRLRPAPPSASLQERIGATLQTAAPRAARSEHRPASPSPSPPTFAAIVRTWLDRLLWSGLGAAAAFAIMLWQRPAVPQASPVVAAVPRPAPTLQQVMSGDETMSWQDEGVHFDQSGRPMLKLRRLAVEHQAWADPQSAAVVQVEVPRQEVVYVPMSLQ